MSFLILIKHFFFISIHFLFLSLFSTCDHQYQTSHEKLFFTLLSGQNNICIIIKKYLYYYFFFPFCWQLLFISLFLFSSIIFFLNFFFPQFYFILFYFLNSFSLIFLPLNSFSLISFSSLIFFFLVLSFSFSPSLSLSSPLQDVFSNTHQTFSLYLYIFVISFISFFFPWSSLSIFSLSVEQNYQQTICDMHWVEQQF